MIKKSGEGKKRIDERLDVLWDAVAIIDDKEYPCKVTNVSTAGAMVMLDVDLEEDQQFLLYVKELNESAVKVAWAKGPEYGLLMLLGDDLKLKDYVDKIGLDDKKKS